MIGRYNIPHYDNIAYKLFFVNNIQAILRNEEKAKGDGKAKSLCALSVLCGEKGIPHRAFTILLTREMATGYKSNFSRPAAKKCRVLVKIRWVGSFVAKMEIAI
jgi:hypothetical protein